ncbi:MAG TPA: choice-of-anchor L domain-containing protein, partial [Mycobacterium sp.]
LLPVTLGETFGTYSQFSFPLGGGANFALSPGICLSSGVLQRTSAPLALDSNLEIDFCGGIAGCGDLDQIFLPADVPDPAELYDDTNLTSGDPAGVEFEIDVTPAAAGTRIRVRMAMASEEFPEWAAGAANAVDTNPPGGCFTDTFVGYLDNEPFTLLPGNIIVNVAKDVIKYNNNISQAAIDADVDEDGQADGIHNVESTPTCDQNLNGADYTNVNWDIEYDGFSDVLTFTSPALDAATPSKRHKLTLMVVDLEDLSLDTTAFIEAFEFCPPPTVVNSTLLNGVSPADGWIDPLGQLDTTTSHRRINQITVEFSETVFNLDGSALSDSAFSMFCTDTQDWTGDPPDPDPNNDCPAVASIDATNNPTVTVFFDGPIPYGEWTTLVMQVEDECGAEADLNIDIASLPADANQDGNVGLADASAFITEFNAGNAPVADMNRDGMLGLADISTWPNNFNGNTGIGIHQWNGRFLPARP